MFFPWEPSLSMMPGGTGTVKKAKKNTPPSADADAGHRRDL